MNIRSSEGCVVRFVASRTRVDKGGLIRNGNNLWKTE